MEMMAERPPKLRRAVTAPIIGRPLPAPLSEAHVNSRCRTKRHSKVNEQEMENIIQLRNRRNQAPITNTKDEDKENSAESEEGVTPISVDEEESQGTYEILNRFCLNNFKQVIT